MLNLIQHLSLQIPNRSENDVLEFGMTRILLDDIFSIKTLLLAAGENFVRIYLLYIYRFFYYN